MEEPVSLTVGAVMSGLLNKPAENSGENLADTVNVAVSRLGWLRDGFTQTGDMEGSQALARTEDAPDSPSRMTVLVDSPSRMTVLVDVVGRRAIIDPEFKSAGATTGG